LSIRIARFRSLLMRHNAGMDEASDLTGFAPKRPSPARIYGYWLGGNNNFAVDREVVEHAAADGDLPSEPPATGDPPPDARRQRPARDRPAPAARP
jgi:hypothetical protein